MFSGRPVAIQLGPPVLFCLVGRSAALCPSLVSNFDEDEHMHD
jgi:hypothetical protein